MYIYIIFILYTVYEIVIHIQDYEGIFIHGSNTTTAIQLLTIGRQADLQTCHLFMKHVFLMFIWVSVRSVSGANASIESRCQSPKISRHGPWEILGQPVLGRIRANTSTFDPKK